MGAPNLSLVIATGFYLLWGVRAQTPPEGSGNNQLPQGPQNVQVSPSPLIRDAAYIVSWDDGQPPCFIAGVNLVEFVSVDFQGTIEVQPTPTQAIQTTSCLSNSDAQGICTLILDDTITTAVGTATSLDPEKVYGIQILWGPTNTIEALFVSRTLGLSSISIGGFNAESTPASPSSDFLTSSSKGFLTASATLFSTLPTAASISTSLPAAATSTPLPGTTNQSSGLNTGAKVGIAIGVVGFALLVLIATLLICRRSRQKQLRALPNRKPYSHDIDSTNRDFSAEKEMHVMSSPVDTLHNGYSGISPVAETQSRSYPLHDGHAATAAHRGSYGSGIEDSASPAQEIQTHITPTAAAGTAIQRKPVGAVTGPTHHLREPGMSDEEVARLEEEERRLDEAIAEAERRRQLQD